MEIMKNAVLSACMISAGLSLIGRIVSGTKLGRSVSFTGELVLLIVLLSPFLQWFRSAAVSDITSDIVFDENSAGTDYEELLLSETASNISRILADRLEAEGIDCSLIEPDVHISESGCIIIERVRIESSAPDTAAGVIKSCLGEETEVIYEADRTY